MARLRWQCLSSDDLNADVTAIHARGGTIGDPSDGGRLRPDGVGMRWRSAWIDDQPLPFVMEDLTPRNLRVTDDPAATTHENGATGLIGATIQAGSDELLKRFDAVFGASVGFGLGWAEYMCGRLASGWSSVENGIRCVRLLSKVSTTPSTRMARA